MSNNRAHLNDGPVEIPAWKSCKGCRHFKPRTGMLGGDCAHETAVRLFVGWGMRYVPCGHDGRVVTPSWCPVLVREG